LDGIYFNNAQNYNIQNANIKRTYDNASSVVFQSEFNKNLIIKWFDIPKNSAVIHNGADLEKINSIKPLQNLILDKYDKVWVCASQWRPHKRLSENIRYFLEHSSSKDCLVIAGKADSKPIQDKRLFYVGNLRIDELISLYKKASYMIHLAWLDHCPNVVVDARASGCQIVCSSAGGTVEVSGTDAIVIEENKWDYEPVNLYTPPELDFSKKNKNIWNIDLNMEKVAEKYAKLLSGEYNEDNKKFTTR